MASAAPPAALAAAAAPAAAPAPAAGKLPRWAEASVKANPNSIHERVCNSGADFALRHHPLAKFVRAAIRAEKGDEGAMTLQRDILCVFCPRAQRIGGGYHPPTKKILLCQNNGDGAAALGKVLTHEMIHAYDDARTAKLGHPLDWTVCAQHACTEIRASNLSSECRWLDELQRGNASFHKGHQECVKRRAELSVSANPFCKAPGQAKLAVMTAWEKCFEDTAPFRHIP